MSNVKRLIDANALEKDMRAYADNKAYCGHYELANGILKAVGRIDDAPTVDAAVVVHGQWIEGREIPSYSNKKLPVVECSECRCFFCDIINVHSFMYHYCPNCGAKMDGGADHE